MQGDWVALWVGCDVDGDSNNVNNSGSGGGWAIDAFDIILSILLMV